MGIKRHVNSRGRGGAALANVPVLDLMKAIRVVFVAAGIADAALVATGIKKGDLVISAIEHGATGIDRTDTMTILGDDSVSFSGGNTGGCVLTFWAIRN